MTAFVPTQLGVMLPSDINDLAAAGIADGEFAKRVAGAWEGVVACEDGVRNRLPRAPLYRMRSLNLASGTTVLSPVVNSGYKWLMHGNTNFLNTTPSAITVSVYLRRSGVDYVVLAGTSVSGNGGVASANNAFVILIPGDELVITTSALGICAFFAGNMIADTDALKLHSTIPTSGNNTIYTVPTGKIATFVNETNAFLTSQVFLSNVSGGTRALEFYIDSTKFYKTPSSNNVSAVITLAPVFLVAGESFILNYDAASGAMVSGIIWEFDA